VLVVASLVLVTVGVGAWYLFGRGDSAQAGDYVSSERRFATAAAMIHFTPQVVQQFDELQEFNDAVDAQANVMEQSLAEFDRMTRDEEGEPAAIALDSVHLAEDSLRAVADFRDAIVTTNDLSDAQAALHRLEAAVAKLDAHAKEWKNL
jgi:hypothetical protein